MKKKLELGGVLLAIMLLGGFALRNGNAVFYREEVAKNESREMEKTKLVISYPSTMAGTKDQELVEEEVEKIVKEEIDIELEFQVFSVEEYTKKIERMLANEEQLDVAFMYRTMYLRYSVGGELYNLGKILQRYGSGIIDALGMDLINTCRVSGELYGLPENRDYAVGWDAYILRKDILDKYHIDADKIDSYEKLEQVFKTVKAGEPDMQIVAPFTGLMLSNNYLSLDLIGTHLENGQSTLVSNVFESEELIKSLNRIRRWYLAGYIDKDTVEERKTPQQLLKEGKLFAYTSRAKPGVETQETVVCGEEVVCVQLGENIVAANEAAATPWVILKDSISPEKSMELMNLFYTNKKIMDLLSYGVEGVHYRRQADGHITYAEGNATNGFIEGAWRMPNQFITYVWEGNPLNLWEEVEKYNEQAIKGCDYGFNFDMTKVASEYITVSSIIEKYTYIIGNGFVDPVEGLSKLKYELEKNEFNKILEEEQRQFDTWLKQQ